MLCEKKDDPEDKLFARISFAEKVGVALLREYVEELEKDYEGYKGLLVAANRFTHYARREAREEHKIWIITSKDPRFDIFQHELVPEHVICSEEEIQQLLDQYNIKKRQLPKILLSDPGVKAIGAKPGQVVKIYRDSRIAGKSVAYRLVVRRPIG
ncbi:MAG: DNA-directed RNA polymerase subunit H [Candidatus Heimdallarchaeota archaeon]|nr:DNA-directed RNA polymerase subunit H [Candidatus Heimdallarchaeota archaeon]